MSGAPGLPARRAAATLVNEVLNGHRMLSDVIEDVKGPLARIEPEQRARAGSLAQGVLRHLAPIDAVLTPMLRKTPPAPVRNVLRVAAFELLIDQVADYAAVDAAVRQVQAMKRQNHLSGLVNAVLRRVSREGQAALDALPPPSLPDWLAAPVANAHGPKAAAAIAAAHMRGAPLDLTPRDPDASEALADSLGGIRLPTGSVRLAAPAQITALPGYDEGEWWVQDAAAALPVRCLGDVRGMEVLDLCAAPGGKTMQLAAAGASVTAVDISARRLERLRRNLWRTGLNAQVIVGDVLQWAPPAPVDVVVLDAPCSATGTLRRHPDLPHARPEPDLAPLLDLQARMIDRALDWLAPGGRLLYCTCSLLPDEGEAQVAAARERHPGLNVAAERPEGTEPEWWSPEGALRLRPDYWPDRGGMDGFFATVLQKAATGR